MFIGPSTFLHSFKKSDLASPLLTANQRDRLSCILCSLPCSPLLHGQPPSPHNWNPGYCALEPLPARTVVFNEIFQENVPWPPRSLDFSVCDFFWWGFLHVNHFSMKTSPGHWKIWMKFADFTENNWQMSWATLKNA